MFTIVFILFVKVFHLSFLLIFSTEVSCISPDDGGNAICIKWILYPNYSLEFRIKNKKAIPYMSKLSHFKESRKKFTVFIFLDHFIVSSLFFLAYVPSSTFAVFRTFIRFVTKFCLKLNEKLAKNIVELHITFACMISKRDSNCINHSIICIIPNKHYHGI